MRRATRPTASPARTFAREALALAREDLVNATYSYRIVPLDPPAPLLHVGGETLYAPWLLPESGELTALGFGVCTLGPKLEARVTTCSASGAPRSRWHWNISPPKCCSPWRRVQDRMLSECSPPVDHGGELHAGDPGLDLDAQATVLRLAEAESIGVRLGDRLLMHPIKSTTLVLGVGKTCPPPAGRVATPVPPAPNAIFARAAAAETA